MRKHEGIVRYASLITIGITSRLFITLPFPRFPFPVAQKYGPLKDTRYIKILRRSAHRCEENKWQYIVIHHSATGKESAASFDNYHPEQRGWENGLAYRTSWSKWILFKGW